PTRKGLFGKFSIILSSSSGFPTDRHWTEEALPGCPKERAPAVSPPIADSRPITSLRAIPRSCPRDRSCSFSGRRFADHGRDLAGAKRSDLRGIVIEIGNAPLNPIQPEA